MRRTHIPFLDEAWYLLLRSGLNIFFLFLPPAAVCVAAARSRLAFNTVQIGCLGLAATAVSGYCTFSSWFVSWHLVKVVGLSFQIAAFAYLVLRGRLYPTSRRMLRPLFAPTGLVLFSGLTVLAWGFAYGGMDNPPPIAEARFSHQLPGDSDLPYLLAHGMMKDHRIPRPIQVDWLASDRPPLQSAMILSQYFTQIGPASVAYQVFSTYIQSLWIFGLWLLLYSIEVDNSAIALTLACCLFSNFVFVNSIFVWPKLLSAAYLLGFLALMFQNDIARGPRRVILCCTAGALLSWSLLSHGGTVFACMGFAPLAAFLLFRKSLSLRSILVVFVTAIVLYIPWMLFQKYVDPPGNRLVKMHLAGVSPIDDRSVGQTLADSYRALTLAKILQNKRENFIVTFRNDMFWPALRRLLFEAPRTEPQRGIFRLKAAKDLNATQFFYFTAALGLYLPGLFLLLFPRPRSKEWTSAALLVLLTLSTDIVWCLVMFNAGITVVHAGAYATVLTSFAAAILGFWVWSNWLAYGVAGVQIALFTWIHVFLLIPYPPTLHVPMACIAAFATVGVVTLLVILGRSNRMQADATHSSAEVDNPAVETVL